MKINIALWYYLKYKVSDIWYFYFVHVINILIGKCPIQIKRKCDMTNETKKCPFCGEEIMAVAKKCKHCGEWLDKEENSKTKECPICGETIPESATKCEHCGEELQKESVAVKINQTNELPQEAKKYNWGPLFAGFIWGFFNGMPKNILIILLVLFLCSFIPVIGILVSICYYGLLIWAGTKGNTWAWNNKNWKSVEEFNNCQIKWVVFPIGICLIIAGIWVAICGI